MTVLVLIIGTIMPADGSACLQAYKRQVTAAARVTLMTTVQHMAPQCSKPRKPHHCNLGDTRTLQALKVIVTHTPFCSRIKHAVGSMCVVLPVQGATPIMSGVCNSSDMV